MKKILLLLNLLVLIISANAQYVNIPDSNFGKTLSYIFPSCVIYEDPTIDQPAGAYFLDTSCSVIASTDSLDLSEAGINYLQGIQYFTSLQYLNLSGNDLFPCDATTTGMCPDLPNSIKYLDISNARLSQGAFGYIPALPNSLVYLNAANAGQMDFNFPALPPLLQHLTCTNDGLYALPALPESLVYLDCSNQNDATLTSSPRSLGGLPALSKSLKYLYCENNAISSLPALPDSLLVLDCAGTGSYDINYDFSYTLFCVPRLPNSLTNLSLPESVGCVINSTPNLPFLTVCNPTNDVQGCRGYPTISGYIFTDYNNDGIKDGYEFYEPNVKLQISNGVTTRYAFTNSNGYYQLSADSVGSYILSVISPNNYKAVPDSISYDFIRYDTAAQQNFALQPTTNIDSVQINIIPYNLAKPNLDFPYLISYSNKGTTTLNANITVNYNNTLLTYDSSSDNTVINNGNNLTLTGINLLPGQNNSLITDFTVKQADAPGELIATNVNITGNSATSNDTVVSIVRSSFDPNNKEASTALTPEEVAKGKSINYIIHFQNTGNDYASTIVIADTLSSLLDASSLQMIGSSLPCTATVNGNIVYFEFLNISLPDSNTNLSGSKGFVSFSIKPQPEITSGSINNTADIYFDYNLPVITNTATTLIQDSNSIVPLKLTSFTALTQPNSSNALLYWSTANEINTKYFIVQQSSDGINFTDIGNVAAKDQLQNTYSYNVVANSPITYYRLKMIDNTGQYSYSAIVSIKTLQSDHGIVILNNPAKNIINIRVDDVTLTNSVAHLLDDHGAVVKEFILNRGSQSIDVSVLPAGEYFIQSRDIALKVFISR